MCYNYCLLLCGLSFHSLNVFQRSEVLNFNVVKFSNCFLYDCYLLWSISKIFALYEVVKNFTFIIWKGSFLPSFHIYLSISLHMQLHNMYTCFERIYNYVVQHHLLNSAILYCSVVIPIFCNSHVYIHLGLFWNFLFYSTYEFALIPDCLKCYVFINLGVR